MTHIPPPESVVSADFDAEVDAMLGMSDRSRAEYYREVLKTRGRVTAEALWDACEEKRVAG